VSSVTKFFITAPFITVGSRPVRVQDPADHAGGGRLAAGAGDTDGLRRAVEQVGQQLGARQHRRPHPPGGDYVRHRVLDGGRGDDDLFSARDAAAVLRKQPDPPGAKELELGRRAALVEGAIGAFDGRAGRLDDQGQGQHAAAANPQKK
jgi:hypothetical protein